MPFFLAHPPRGFRVEDEYRRMVGRSREDAVALVRVAWRDVQRRLIQDDYFAHGINGEAAAGFLLMAIRVQIPVPAVVNDTLRRDDPVALFITGAGVIAQSQPLPPERAIADRLKV